MARNGLFKIVAFVRILFGSGGSSSSVSSTLSSISSVEESVVRDAKLDVGRKIISLVFAMLGTGFVAFSLEFCSSSDVKSIPINEI